MLGIRPTRFVHRHCRAALVWAAIPLAVFNGRTVVGCGCTGHFEAVCHCGCCSTMQGDQHHGNSACACCAGHGFSHGSCPCCNQNRVAHQCCNSSSDSDCGLALGGHHCKSFVKHETIPVTVVSVVDAGDFYSTFFTMAAVGQSPIVIQSHLGKVVDFDTGRPPNDLVVTFHRLVI
jgi:hypothetical protein